MTKYDDVIKCPICDHNHDVKVVDTGEGYTSEARTSCNRCGHHDYWAHGWYEIGDYNFNSGYTDAYYGKDKSDECEGQEKEEYLIGQEFLYKEIEEME